MSLDPYLNFNRISRSTPAPLFILFTISTIKSAAAVFRASTNKKNHFYDNERVVQPPQSDISVSGCGGGVDGKERINSRVGAVVEIDLCFN